VAVNGWIILDKPLGLGSTQAVSTVKRACRTRGLGKVKVGHGGTLDPLATGVLPIALGEATKLAGRMLDASKSYDFTIAFGTETDGLDAEGAVLATSKVRPTLAAALAVLPRFTGPIEQVPPAFSAIKVGGERAYDRARAGEDVVMTARAVTIYSLCLRHPREGGEPSDAAAILHHLAMDSRLRGNDESGGDALGEITLSAHVSKGTYIRSLARDIARALGTVGHVAMLRRTRAGPFGLESAISLDKLKLFGQSAPHSDVILPLEAGLADIPALTLSPEAAGAVRQGRALTGVASQDGLYWAHGGDGRPVALVELSAGTLKILRGFNL
jgi:tRNA pseudouridine55 synthase